MHQFDQEKMVKLVSELRKSVVRLESIANLSLEEFQNNADKIGMVRSMPIRLTQVCLIPRDSYVSARLRNITRGLA